MLQLWAKAAFCVLCLLAAGVGDVLAVEWDGLAERLKADGFDEQETDALFTALPEGPDSAILGRKMLALFQRKYGSKLVRSIQERLAELGYDAGGTDGKAGYKTRWAIERFQLANGFTVDGRATEGLLQLAMAADQRAAEGLEPPDSPPRKLPPVYETIMTPERLREAEVFWCENKEALRAVSEEYSIPVDIMVGLLTVETRVGKYLGDDKAFLVLASMAACAEYETIARHLAKEEPTARQEAWLKKRTAEKGDWAYNELKALLAHARDNGADPLAMAGSIYGAIGICQFMPSNAMAYGMDGDGDGIVNLFQVPDALHSLGNFLRTHGWKGDMSGIARQRKVLYRYNHSNRYVNTILAVAGHLRAWAGEDGPVCP